MTNNIDVEIKQYIDKFKKESFKSNSDFAFNNDEMLFKIAIKKAWNDLQLRTIPGHNSTQIIITNEKNRQQRIFY